MSFLSSLTNPSPYHLLSYGTLLGTTFYQSFIGGTTAYSVLPRPQFSSLQQKIFPIYFSIQTALPAVLALTFPAPKSILAVGAPESAGGFWGVLAPENRWSVLLPIGTMFVAGLANLVFVGPATTKVMKERKHQETRDGKKSYDQGPHSDEMQKLNKQFGTLHGVSSLLNMVELIAAIYYGVVLSERL